MKQERKEQNWLIENAKAFFAEYGLDVSMEEFFARYDVKEKVQKAYDCFEGNLENIVIDLDVLKIPTEIQERAKEVVQFLKGNKKQFEDDLKLSLMCSLYLLLQSMDSYVGANEQVLQSFKDAFTNSKNTKFMKTFDQICESLVTKMLFKTLGLIFDSVGKDEEISALLKMLVLNLETTTPPAEGGGLAS